MVYDAGLDQLQALPNLRTLLLRGCAVHGGGLERLQSLETIELTGCNLYSSGFDAIAALPRLQRLNLTGMWLDAGNWNSVARVAEA